MRGWLRPAPALQGCFRKEALLVVDYKIVYVGFPTSESSASMLGRETRPLGWTTASREKLFLVSREVVSPVHVLEYSHDFTMRHDLNIFSI